MKRIFLSLFCSYTIIWYLEDWNMIGLNSLFKLVILSTIVWGAFRLHISSKFSKFIFSFSSAISFYYLLHSIFYDMLDLLNTLFVQYKTLLDQALTEFMNWDLSFESLTMEVFIIIVFSLIIWYGFLSSNEWLRYVLSNQLLAFSIVVVLVDIGFRYTDKGEYIYFAAPLLISIFYHLIIDRVREGGWRIFFSSFCTYLLLCLIVIVMITSLEDGRNLYDFDVAHYKLWANRLFMIISFISSFLFGLKYAPVPVGKQRSNIKSRNSMSQRTL